LVKQAITPTVTVVEVVVDSGTAEPSKQPPSAACCSLVKSWDPDATTAAESAPKEPSKQATTLPDKDVVVVLLAKLADNTQLPSKVSCTSVMGMPPYATARARSSDRLSSKQATIGSVAEEALAAVVAMETESTQLPRMVVTSAVSGIRPDSTTRATASPNSSVRQARILDSADWASSSDAANRHLLSAASCSGVDATKFESADSAPSAPMLSAKHAPTDSPRDTMVAGSLVGARVALGSGVSVGTAVAAGAAVGSELDDPPQAATASIVTPINMTIITLSIGQIIKTWHCYY
jgi:hypothetical protein